MQGGASGWRPPNPQMVHFALTENSKVSSIASLLIKIFVETLRIASYESVLSLYMSKCFHGSEWPFMDPQL